MNKKKYEIELDETMIGVLYRLLRNEQELQYGLLSDETANGDIRFVEIRKHIVNECEKIIKEIKGDKYE